MTDEKTPEPKTPPVVEQLGHKHPPVGPKTSNPVPEWRLDRDYEQFMPSPNF